MKNIIRLYSLALFDFIGINALYRLFNRNKAVILWYHGICDEGSALSTRHIPKSVFRRQLSYLKQKGYIFVSLTELLNALKSRKKIGKYVVLTFDDGFNNIVKNAYPIMKEFDAKGCFYIVSDLIGTNNLLWTTQIEMAIRTRNQKVFQFLFKDEIFTYELSDEKSYQYAFRDIKSKLRTIPNEERLKHLEQFNISELENVPKEFFMANWHDIQELDPNILEIGSHTRSHPNCSNLATSKEIEDEIYTSKVNIQKITGRKVDHFCYPAGSYNNEVISHTMKSGYESAVTVDDGFIDGKSDLYQLKRLLAYRQFPLFKSGISGSYALLKSLNFIPNFIKFLASAIYKK